MIRRLTVVLALLATVGCGGTAERDRQGGTGASAGASGRAGFSGASGSAGAGAASGEPACPFESPLAFGAPYQPDPGCVDTTQYEPVACFGDENPERAGYHCVERRSDGARFWTFTMIRELVLDESVWQFCPGLADVDLPPPCFAAACETAPRSLCSPDQTIAWYICGSPDSAWDENCCRRKECVAECHEDCIVPNRVWFWDCWGYRVDGCDCAGFGPGTVECHP
jgi:hypothetical protein